MEFSHWATDDCKNTEVISYNRSGSWEHEEEVCQDFSVKR